MIWLWPRETARAKWSSTYGAAGLFYGALIAVTVATVFYWPMPRMNDLVDHWARLTLYHTAPDDPISGLYRIHFGLIPNLGVDLLYLALWPLLTPLMAVKLGAALGILLPAAGAFAIHRALFEKPSPSLFIIPFSVSTSRPRSVWSISPSAPAWRCWESPTR